MFTEGLAVTRAVHDRYHASRRNPWNEVECGDHYARSMASYGVFLAACGFECHGPNGHLGFAPRVMAKGNKSQASSFKAAFTTPQGWGTFSQESSAQSVTCRVRLKWGKLRVQSLALQLPESAQPTNARVQVNGRKLS